MLCLIGLGFGAKGITLKGLECTKKCDIIYLDSYTSRFDCSISDLEKLFNKKIILADRKLLEEGFDAVLKKAKQKNICILIPGTPLFATTHINLILKAKKDDVKVEIINNASVFDAIGITGLQLYNFGKITSIPFENKDVKTPIEVLDMNTKNNLHTLFLLDLEPDKNRYMTVNDALNYLLKNGMEDRLAVGCATLGTENEINVANAKELFKVKFKNFPQCLIIPAKKLHFMEEEVLGLYKLK